MQLQHDHAPKRAGRSFAPNCSECARLRERVAELEEEIAWRNAGGGEDVEAFQRLHKALPISAQSARILYFLARADGPVTRGRLLFSLYEARGLEAPLGNVITVYVSILRRRISWVSITCVQGGRGANELSTYELNTEARERVRAIADGAP